MADINEQIEHYLAALNPDNTPKANRKAPWPDFMGNPIYEGSRIIHPDGTTGLVCFFEFEEEPGEQWRVFYDDGNREPDFNADIGRLCLQVGDKGQAIVVQDQEAG